VTSPPKRRWFLYWLLIFGVAAFGVPEAIALTDPDSGDTLTESLRWLVGLHPVIKGAFLGFIGWFVWHILWQKPRRKD
jgi:hypothetical protein